MKLTWNTLAFFMFSLAWSCSGGQAGQQTTELSPAEFAQKITQQPNAVILDVRSPEEFAGGALPGALNVDWNGPDFESATAKLNKTEPVFVYCLSGGRSASAAAHLRNAGFAQVYEMAGGLMKWRADGIKMGSESGKPEKAKGMQRPEFEALLQGDKIILVDFYADWCGPCKRMKPDLDQLAGERATSLTVLRIDADAHPDLALQLGVSDLPTILIFKNKQEVNRKTGYLTKAGLEALL